MSELSAGQRELAVNVLRFSAGIGKTRAAQIVDSLTTLIARWCEVEREAGAAEVRARVEAVLSANERHNGLVETVQLRRRIRNALNGGE